MVKLSQQPVYALCGLGRYPGGVLPSRGRFSAAHWDASRLDPSGFRGLLDGCGDPVNARLDLHQWAVVRVEDADGPIDLSPSGLQPGTVKFREGVVLYGGERRGALEALLLLGVDPSAMAVRLALPDAFGVADAGDYGVAVSAARGVAQAGRHGQAYAQDGGLAIVGASGTAKALDDGGIALAAADGSATAGDEGIAIGRGHDAAAVAGLSGTAASIGYARALSVGDGGTALALRSVGAVRAGASSLTVVRQADDGWTHIEAGEGSVVALRQAPRLGHGGSVKVFTVGRGSLDPKVRYLWKDGTLSPDRGEDRTRSGSNQTDEKGSSDDPVLPYHRECDAIVLCKSLPVDEERGLPFPRLRAADWDPDPLSSAGFFGLLWGEGDPAVVDLIASREWMLVRVDFLVPVPAGERGRRGVVKFAEGDVVYFGSRAEVLTQLLRLGAGHEGLDAPLLSVAAEGRRAAADADGVAVAARGGWAFAPHGAEAEADREGVAIAGQGSARAGADGLAIAEEPGPAAAGERGVAISEGKRYGEAIAGAGGVAIGRGRYKTVSVGFGGAAVTTAGGFVTAGDEGIAVGRNAQVHAGRDGIAVVEGGTVSGNTGCLLVAIDRGDGVLRVAEAIVGADGIEPFIRHEFREGRLQPIIRRQPART